MALRWLHQIELPQISRLACAWLALITAGGAGAAGVALLGDAHDAYPSAQFSIDGAARTAAFETASKQLAQIVADSRSAPGAPDELAVAPRRALGPTLASARAPGDSPDPYAPPAASAGAPAPAPAADDDASAPDIDPQVLEAAAKTGRIIILSGAKSTPSAIDGAEADTDTDKPAAPHRPIEPVPAPIAALLEKGPDGKLPRIGADGRTAFSAYSRRQVRSARPKIAVIVGGLGLSPELTERAIDELPPEIALAFAPYAKDLDMWTRKARAAGHELILEAPMEAHGAPDKALGPAGLLTTRDTAENLRRLEWIMSRFQGYFAVSNYLGGKFLASDAAQPVLAEIARRGVGFIDDTGAATPVRGAPLGRVDRVIDPRSDEAAFKDVLDALETQAKVDGSVIVKSYAYADALDALEDWASGLGERGLALAPPSAVMRERPGGA